MDIRDLMVGDWVRVVDDNTDESFIGLVKAISEIGNVNVLINEGSIAYPYHIDCIEPIPLTAEILEKNGWASDNYNDSLHVYNLRYDKGHSTIAISDDKRWSIEIAAEITKKDKRGRADLITFIRDWCNEFCVHELQHALRLCGIDKEIML